MKVVILAGGRGTRISEESHLRPKPMIEIGEIPILAHIMKIYSAYGHNDFIICAGYKQQIIKEYFAHYFLYNNDVTFNMSANERIIHERSHCAWNVTIVDTGLDTMTGGRIKRVKSYIGNQPFMLTYGDGVGNIDINKVLECHKKSGKAATLSCYNYGQSKGVVEVDKNGIIKTFREKSDSDGDLINIGFMVLEPRVFDYISGDDTVFEDQPLKMLAKLGQLNSYLHKGFWQCMDTLNEKNNLEKLWQSGKAPWKVWKD